MKDDETVDDSVKWSRTKWEKWVEEQVALRRAIYGKSPADMTAAYQRESGHRNDYHGRELLA